MVTGQCNGENVIIEISNPKGIGLSGKFATDGKETDAINYKNAIAVPYFSKIGLPDSIPQTIGTELYFEFRELTQEERENPHLFSTKEPIVCLTIYGRPYANPLIISKVIS